MTEEKPVLATAIYRLIQNRLQEADTQVISDAQKLWGKDLVSDLMQEISAQAIWHEGDTVQTVLGKEGTVAEIDCDGPYWETRLLTQEGKEEIIMHSPAWNVKVNIGGVNEIHRRDTLTRIG